MKNVKAVKKMDDDMLAQKMMDALCVRDLSHHEIIALGDDLRHPAMVLETLKNSGVIEAYRGPIQPSTCMYKLSAK